MPDKAIAVQPAKRPVAFKPISSGKMADRMNSVFDSISRRAYQIFENHDRIFGNDLEHWLEAEKEFLHPVRVELNETDKSLHLKAEVPGFSEKELEISIGPRRVVIAGKHEASKEEKKGKKVYSEIYSDQLMRIVDLPVEVESEKVEARLKNGVLELTLPKTPKARGANIQPKAA
jgi:HSP20 family protein